MVFYFVEWNKANEYLTFSEEALPSGVLHFVLFDQKMNPLSERLIFSKNDAFANVDFHTDKEVYDRRDKVTATISLSDSLFYSFEGHFSIAVTDDNDIAVDETTTILSSLLLSSELKGYIENPAYYLQDNPASNAALDLLMMTHGWRRYNVPEVVKGNQGYPKFPFQQFQEISGQVKSSILSRPVADSEILVMMKDGGAGVTSTDKDGSFIVSDLEFPDSTSFFVQALSKRGSGNLQLFMDNESFPELVYAPQNLFSRQKKTDAEIKNESIVNTFITKAEQRAKFDEDMWVIHLQDVEITAPPKKNLDEPRLQYWGNQYSEKTIRREEFEKFNFPNLGYLLTYAVPGVSFRSGEGSRSSVGNGISIRGRRPPLILIDGRESIGEIINISEIESIDIIKNGIVFGMRGADGVISITTRRGENSPITEKTNHVVYTPVGYQKPVEFYAPIYETLEARQSNIPDFRTTIFWKPDVVISDENNQATFEFYTSDFKTTYSVVIEGITADGRIIRQVEKIVVSD